MSRRRPGDGRMTLREHLSELRQRLMYVVLAFVVATLLGFAFSRQALEFFLGPALAAVATHPSVQIVYGTVTEGLMLQFRLAAYVGLILVSPIAIYQIVAYVSPGLTGQERRYLMRLLPLGLLLFLIGCAAAFVLFLPFALSFFLGYADAEIGMIMPVSNLLAFTFGFVLPFGVVFELPLVAWLLASIGLLQPAFLQRNRKYAILLIAVLSAVLTPPDLLSMIVMGVPMLALYEVSIWITWLTVRARKTA